MITNYQNLSPNTNIGQNAQAVAPMALQSLNLLMPGVGTLASGLFTAGVMGDNAIKKDMNGLYKSDVGALAGSLLNPTKNWDIGAEEMKNGNFFKGLWMSSAFGGVTANKERQDKVDELRKKNHTQLTIGNINPMAGRFSGESTGVKSEYVQYKPIF